MTIPFLERKLRCPMCQALQAFGIGIVADEAWEAGGKVGRDPCGQMRGLHDMEYTQRRVTRRLMAGEKVPWLCAKHKREAGSREARGEIRRLQRKRQSEKRRKQRRAEERRVAARTQRLDERAAGFGHA